MVDYDWLRKVERDLVDQGKLIEAGWVGMRIAAISPEAGKLQLAEMRLAFFAGAQHLFSSIITILDEDAEPTDEDLRRMDCINTELATFLAEFEKRHGLGGRVQ